MSVVLRMKVTSYPVARNQRWSTSKLTPERMWPMCGSDWTVRPHR